MEDTVNKIQEAICSVKKTTKYVYGSIAINTDDCS